MKLNYIYILLHPLLQTSSLKTIFEVFLGVLPWSSTEDDYNGWMEVIPRKNSQFFFVKKNNFRIFVAPLIWGFANFEIQKSKSNKFFDLMKHTSRLNFKRNKTGSGYRIFEETIDFFIQWRVWSWLRMNASGRLNTCKSRGSRLEFRFRCWRPAHGWVTRMQPTFHRGIAFGNGN